VAARTGIDRETALAALTDTPVASDAALVQLGRSIEAIRREVVG
jgi:hypothetical protein